MSIDFTKTFVDNNIKYRIDSEDTCTVIDCIDKEQTKIEIPSVVKNFRVKAIGNYAFYYCSSLTSITIPDSVTSIGGYAFYECSRLKTKFKNYKAVHLKNGQLRCRDFIYKINEWTPEIDHLALCKNGYHYCTNLFDIFNYYSGTLDEDIAIFECEVGDNVISASDGTSKYCTNTIKLTKRLYREDVIKILNGEE